MKFDNNGYIFPYKPHKLTVHEFELIFGSDEHRKFLLSKLFQFIGELKQITTDDVVSWIDGSFVTQKNKPNDIDVVVFINFQYFKSKENQLTTLKERQELVDLYYVKVFPEDHPNCHLTKLDKLDWLHFFTTDRKNKRKGFIELTF
jgi:hypothetical protein